MNYFYTILLLSTVLVLNASVTSETLPLDYSFAMIQNLQGLDGLDIEIKRLLQNRIFLEEQKELSSENVHLLNATKNRMAYLCEIQNMYNKAYLYDITPPTLAEAASQLSENNQEIQMLYKKVERSLKAGQHWQDKCEIAQEKAYMNELQLKRSESKFAETIVTLLKENQEDRKLLRSEIAANHEDRKLFRTEITANQAERKEQSSINARHLKLLEIHEKREEERQKNQATPTAPAESVKFKKQKQQNCCTMMLLACGINPVFAYTVGGFLISMMAQRLGLPKLE